jgi:hypothetical protein
MIQLSSLYSLPIKKLTVLQSIYTGFSLFLYFYYYIRYSVDFDLKKLVDESALDADANRIEAKKTVKKLFEEKYKGQSVKADKKAAGVSYFFNKLRF